MSAATLYFVFVPALLSLLLFEAWWLRRRGVANGYRVRETWVSLGCAVGQLAIAAVTAPFLAAAYEAARVRWALFTWDLRSPGPWIAAVVFVDLGYYAYHRASHAVPLLWAIHAPHHQTETMNLSAAVRLPWLSDLPLTVFMAPLTVLGIPQEAFLAAVGAQLVWQTLMHTRLFERPGPLSWVLHVPATHRIHHGRSRMEAAKNLAPMFSVWDRLFGTFSKGPEPIAYGSSFGPSGGGILQTQWGPFATVWARVRRVGPAALFSFDS